MSEKLQIETARWRDYPEIAELVQEVHNIHSQARPDIYKQQDHIFTEDEFKKSIVSPMEIFFAARTGEEIVGICQVKFISIPETDMTVKIEKAKVEVLCVKGAYQRQGIGTQLLMQAEREAVKRNIHSMELTVWAFNEEAIEYYRKYGMKCQRMVMEKLL